MSKHGQTTVNLRRAAPAASITRVAYWAKTLRSLRSYHVKRHIAEWMME
jgi:hypothetical protein